MTTREIGFEAPGPSRAGRVLQVAIGALLAAVSIAGVATRPALSHLSEHAYSILGLGFISAAAYTHSLFTGLLVSGICFLLLEWKASE